jgi:hypothetical protein
MADRIVILDDSRYIRLSADPENGIEIHAVHLGENRASLSQEVTPEQCRRVAFELLAVADDDFEVEDFRGMLAMLARIREADGDLTAAAAAEAASRFPAIDTPKAAADVVREWDTYLGEGSVLHPMRVAAAASVLVLARTVEDAA